MTNHLLTQTLPREVADLARYYTQGTRPGTEEDQAVAALAREVLAGNLPYSEAIAELIVEHASRTADIDTEEGRLTARLDQAIQRQDFENHYGGPLAEPRRDMHPLVAQGLGIPQDRPLTRDELNALLAGRRADGEKIEGKHYATLRTTTNPKTGEAKELVPIGSYDFCLTPDKSVSVAWAFGTPAEQAAIYQAHRDAAEATMEYLAARIGQARKGDGGQDGADPGHVGWVSFDHYTSRPTLWIARDENGKRITESVPVQVAGDPDLHTHFTVMNAVFCENGRVGSLDTAGLKGFVKEAGALYQAHIAANLRRVGADVFLDQETGAARLLAIPEAVRDHFSKKTRNGEEAAREYAKAQGLDWDTLSPERRAGLLKAGTQGAINAAPDDVTRGKLAKDDMADFASWRQQAIDLGWSHRSIEAYGPPAPALTHEQRTAMAYEEALPWLERDLDSRAVITGSDARTAALRGLISAGIEGAEDIDTVTRAFRTEGVRQHGEVTALIWGQEDRDGRARISITTAMHEAQEAEFMRLARAAAADRSDALTRAELQQAVRQTGLVFEGEHGRAQEAAMRRLGEGGRLGVVVGAAGAGKTTLLQPLVAAWKAQGRTVYGSALASRQSDDLAEAGIEQRNIRPFDIFVASARKGDFQLDAGSVVVVDELSLLGTRQGLDLLRLQEQHGFRVAMIGDDKQCASIEAGPIIELARKALGREQVPEILTTVRQQSEREREVVGLLREGRAAEALAMKREDGSAMLVPGGYREAVERTALLVAERLRANAADPRFSLTVSAPTNADAHRLGVAIREQRRALGQVGADQVRIKAADRDGNAYDMALAPGDRVRLFASVTGEGERGSIGRNGSVLTVLSADAKGMRIRNAKGREALVAWARLADAQGRIRLAYGEVMTTHTAQGSTATEHVYALPGGSKAVNGFSAYSSGTRHRRASFIITSEGAEKSEVARQRPLNDVRPISREDVWANVARNLGRQPVKDTALAFLDRAASVRRGAARSLQNGLRPAELRVRDGQPATELQETFARRREAQAAAPLVAQMARDALHQRGLMDRLRDAGMAFRSTVEWVRTGRQDARERMVSGAGFGQRQGQSRGPTMER